MDQGFEYELKSLGWDGANGRNATKKDLTRRLRSKVYAALSGDQVALTDIRIVE